MPELIEQDIDATWSALSEEAIAFIQECRTKQIKVVSATGLGMAPLILATMYFATRHADIGIVTTSTMVSGGLIWYVNHNIKQRQKRGNMLTKRLLESSDARAVPLLLEIISSDVTFTKQVHANIGGGIESLLSQLREEHGHLFRPNHITRLISFFSYSEVEPIRKQAVSCAILQALGYIGDERVLRFLTQLIDRRAITPEEQETTHIAQQSVLVLQARLTAQNERETYLRASKQPDQVETLLRPSQPSQEQTELLLRPIIQEVGSSPEHLALLSRQEE